MRRASPARQLLELVGVLLSFAAAGAGAGWLWERWWSPLTGVVVDGRWVAGYRPQGEAFVFDFPSLQRSFDATAQYVVIGLAAGLVLGVVWSLVGRGSEIAMLLTVTLGSAVAALIAYRLGTHLGPVDPESLQGAAADYTVLPSALRIEGASPFVAWPLGALLGLALTYLMTSARNEPEPEPGS